jgi:hypothetical protein
MSHWKRILALVAASAFIGCASDADVNVDEKWLFERLQVVAASEVPSQNLIVQTFDLPPSCLQSYCRFTIKSESGHKYSGRLSGRPEGIIFVIDDLSDQHIRRVAVKKRFETTDPKQVCFDSPCWYLNSYNDWGLLAFGVESPAAQSIKSVVINTEDYGRLVSARAKAGVIGR